VKQQTEAACQEEKVAKALFDAMPISQYWELWLDAKRKANKSMAYSIESEHALDTITKRFHDLLVAHEEAAARA
jgi:hypothetical protein